MAARSKARGRAAGASGEAANRAARESAQKIWLAGLGAFERAKTEGPRMFEALVEQGRAMGARAVGAADEALKAMRAADYSGKWDKLEQVFEERVSRSLSRLGVLTSREVGDLSRQVEELNESVRALMRAGPKAPRKAAARRGTRKAKPAAGRAKRASRARRA